MRYWSWTCVTLAAALGLLYSAPVFAREVTVTERGLLYPAVDHDWRPASVEGRLEPRPLVEP